MPDKPTDAPAKPPQKPPALAIAGAEGDDRQGQGQAAAGCFGASAVERCYGVTTGIEWTDETWNPSVGCDIVSPGCRDCYAMKMAARCEAMGIQHYAGLTKKVNGRVVWTGKINEAPQHIQEAPLHWKKGRKIFVNSMSDLFHEDVPDSVIWTVIEAARKCPQHIFQVLTKRSSRMGQWMERVAFMPDNLWLGVSVEDCARKVRIDDLRHTRAKVRFVSFEPLLEYLGGLNLDGIGWAIIGGESGTDRIMNPDWARSILSQCHEAGIPAFMKQMGGKAKAHMPPIPEDMMVRKFPGGVPC